MRCEGAENPPCRRCRHAGLECLFEKPTREASLTGEAGLEYVPFPSHPPHQLTRPFSFRRIRSLEAHVADIRQSQVAIQSTLTEIVSHLRNGLGPTHRSPSVYQPPPFTPDLQSQDSPATATASTPTNASAPTPAPADGRHSRLVLSRTTSTDGHPWPSTTIVGYEPAWASASALAQQSSGSFHSIMGAPGHRPPPHAGEFVDFAVRFTPIR
jgi:hypothetical protein